jgi:hypothetical protein
MVMSGRPWRLAPLEVASSKFIVPLGTATNPPTASVSLTLTVGGAKAAAKRKAKPVTVGKATVRIPAGKTRALKVKLNKKGQALLRRNRKLKVSLRIVATAPAGTSASRKRSLTIKRRR